MHEEMSPISFLKLCLGPTITVKIAAHSRVYAFLHSPTSLAIRLGHVNCSTHIKWEYGACPLGKGGFVFSIPYCITLVNLRSLCPEEICDGKRLLASPQTSLPSAAETLDVSAAAANLTYPE